MQLALFITLLFLEQTASETVVRAVVGSTVELPCISASAYPVWSGPYPNKNISDVYNYIGSPNFNPALEDKATRMGWVNMINLTLSNVQRKDDGMYQCSPPTPIQIIRLIVRVQPTRVVISGAFNSPSNRWILQGSEGVQQNLTCLSFGGYPEQTVQWYRGSTNSQPLASTFYQMVNDTATNTRNITQVAQIVPGASDDNIDYICHCAFADDPKLVVQENAILYLNLRPEMPTITPLSNLKDNDNKPIARCKTGGFRPQTSFNLTWIYRNTVMYYGGIPVVDNSSGKYSVLADFQQTVKKEDNGQQLTCSVTHQTLDEPRIAKLNLSVMFMPEFVILSGEQNSFVASGTNPLSLKCTTSTANPASSIVWKNGTVTITNSVPYVSSPGNYNGVVISQNYTVYPTRYMDGSIISCEGFNAVSNPFVSSSVTLDLTYSPLVTVSQSSLTSTEGERAVLTCRAHSKPAAIITWSHNGIEIERGSPANNVYNYSIDNVNRTHFGTYKCKASNEINPDDEKNISLTVRFKPLKATIEGNMEIVANGQNILTLICTSGSSNPVSSLSWTNNSNHINADVKSTVDTAGDFGGMQRRETLTLKPLRENDGDRITCEANNSLNSGNPVSASVQLDLKYGPIINSMRPQTVVEGNYSLLICSASSKPPSFFRWYKEGLSSVQNQGAGTANNNQLVYNITTVKRADVGIYKCVADNGEENVDSKSVALTVQYPPDVVIEGSNTSVLSSSVQLTCNATGMPNTDYKYGEWIQEWPGYGVVSRRPGAQTLSLAPLTYEHSGIYRCNASNGIKIFGTDKEYMEGSMNLQVKSFPVISNDSTCIIDSGKIHGKLNNWTSCSIYYYSNTGTGSVTCYRVLNDTRQVVSDCSSSNETALIRLNVFSHTVSTTGMKVIISIHIDSTEDFGLYDVEVINEFGTKTLTFEIVAQGPPEVPYDIEISDLQQESATVSWFPGFHGGFDQTVIVQLSTDETTWINKSVVFHGQNLSRSTTTLEDLDDSMTYFIRLFAVNIGGKSSFTQNLNFTTLIKDVTEMPFPSAVVGGVAGGVGACVILAVIGVVILLKRRGYLGKGTQKSKKHDDRKRVYKDEDEDAYGMKDNPMYVSADLANNKKVSGDPGEVYSEVKRKPAQDNPNGVYAQVKKSKKHEAKKGSPNKESKRDQKGKKREKDVIEGDVYENAVIHSNKQHPCRDEKETIYENPETSKAESEKMTVNREGLVYAELAFNNQSKGKKKLVIHGLDDKTTYGEIDFSRKAEPLQESDEDENKKQ